jgi:hypothetical protein
LLETRLYPEGSHPGLEETLNEPLHHAPTGLLEPPAATDGDPLVGRVLGERYRIEMLLGSGGMGAVYRASHVVLNKPVAVKVLTLCAEGDALERFLREAKAAAAIRHPGVAEVYDYGVTPEGAPYYVMEYLEGTDLDHRLAARGPLPPAEAIDLTRRVAEALTAAHAAGIVHRDLKPANIFLVPQAHGGEVVKVVDFGISKVISTVPGADAAQLTVPGLVFGSPSYMSPEQAAGRPVDPRSDIYSLGVVLYEMLCGNPPFDGPEIVLLMKAHLVDPPPPLAVRCPGLRVPAALEALVMRALSKEKERRFASMTELDAALAAIDLGTPGHGGTRQSSPASARSRRRAVWLAVLAGALVAGLAVAWLARLRPGQDVVGVPPRTQGADASLPVVVRLDAGIVRRAPEDAATSPQPRLHQGTDRPRPQVIRRQSPPPRPDAGASRGPVERAPEPRRDPPRGYRLDDLKPYGRSRGELP